MSIRVAELFAGVGGFRLGFEEASKQANGSGFRVVWANQWEPSLKRQHAAEIYAHRWRMEKISDNLYASEDGDLLSNENIEKVATNEIPDHDILCGGFPCQDYSVARTTSGELGIKGEKGKLWTSIHRIVKEKQNKPRMILLENVPRLLNSPANQRGLNFSVILMDLLDLGYSVEWRVLNAAEYGFPQRRKRVFILAYLNDAITTPSCSLQEQNPAQYREFVSDWLAGKSKSQKSPFAEAFPCSLEMNTLRLDKIAIGEYLRNKTPFSNTGYAWVNQAGEKWSLSAKSKSLYNGEKRALGDVIVDEVPDNYIIKDPVKLRKYRYIKGEQKEWRIRKDNKAVALEIDCKNGMNLWDFYQELTNSYSTAAWAESFSSDGYAKGIKLGIVYHYSAGAMAYPDLLQNPSRTIITAEVGSSVSRTRHVVEHKKNSFRRLMPLELERLNGFPENWTELEKISDSRRGFLMGNALVVGLVERLGKPIESMLEESQGE